MANFKVHIGGAAAASGLLATLCLGGKLANPQEVLALSALGTIGGILPDVDSDNSTPLKLIFTSLAGILAFLIMFSQADTRSILELWLIWGAVYAGVRYPLLNLFTQLTVHRGMFHSLVAALFFWFLATGVTYYVFDSERGFAWLAGFFVFFGFVVHLALDEIYSVDLMDRRLKKSFGTALKPLNAQDWKTSMLFGIAALLAFLATPSADVFVAALADGTTYHNLASNFLP